MGLVSSTQTPTIPSPARLGCQPPPALAVMGAKQTPSMTHWTMARALVPLYVIPDGPYSLKFPKLIRLPRALVFFLFPWKIDLQFPDPLEITAYSYAPLEQHRHHVLGLSIYEESYRGAVFRCFRPACLHI